MNWRNAPVILGFVLVGLFPLRAGPLEVLFSFTGTGGDYAGADPKGSPILDGSTLYGFTAFGGPGENGVIFSVGTDGSGYHVLASFSANDSAGDQPHHGYLTLDGTLIIRPIVYGGENDNGTVFSVQTNGTNPTMEHSFSATSSSPTGLGDGGESHSGLLAGGGQLYYGVTALGGTNGGGVIYSYNAATASVTTLYAFAGASGSDPHGQLSWDSTGTLLLGMTREGGTGIGNGNTNHTAPGVIFSFDPVTSQYTTLYNFTDADGTPYFTDHGILTLGTGANSTTIYGLTAYGGTADNGAIFSLSETGATSLTVLHSFLGGSDGSDPFGSLVLGPDGLLYGLTRDGGAHDDGTLFRIDQDGSAYTVLASFDDSTGKHPIDNVVFSPDGTLLYGFTDEGGANDDGTVFTFSLVPVPEARNFWLLAFVTVGVIATRHLRGRLFSDS